MNSPFFVFVSFFGCLCEARGMRGPVPPGVPGARGRAWKMRRSVRARVAGLAAEAVQGAALALEGVHDVHGGHGLPAGVLGVGDGVTDDVLEEHLEDSPGLLVDEAGDTLDTSPPRKAADGRLCDSLDVVTQHLPVPLGTSLSKSFSSLSTSSHFCSVSETDD